MVKTLIIIAGPTAIGKTSLAIRLARYYKTEIISADSRQFYKEMAIGTAKPDPEELSAVKHHFIDSHSVNDTFTAGNFEKEALKVLENLFIKHDQVIMVGGSGLFINAICNGFDELPVATDEIRNQLNKDLEEQGIEYLQKMLKEVDPVYFAEVDINNPQRLIRALEVYKTSGQTFSSYRSNTRKPRPFNIISIALNTDREKLYERINSRVDQMISSGLTDEVKGLLKYRHLNALQTVGYSEIFDYLDGKCSLEEAIEKIKQNTRRFAKRQITWFKKSDNIRWFDPEDYNGILNYLNQLIPFPLSGEQKS